VTRGPGFAAVLLVLTLASPAVSATDPWAPPGDARLRHDLQLLADAGIVHAPLSTWPVSWSEVARDLEGAGRDQARPAHLEAVLARVRLAATAATHTGDWRGEASIAGSEEPMELRRFAAVPREHAEVSAAAQYTGERFTLRLQGTVVENASDGQTARADGSYAGVALGNWIVTAGLMDRWWGPGWEGSLIYGSNQRPMPALTIERNYSDGFEHPWLRWIGQWRLAATMGQLEGDRNDAPHARFFGMRLTWKPHQRVEVGLTRSAQWCGTGRPCDLGTFWDLLLGQDNDQPLAEQPGNQMAGLDLRWALPWVPVAVYAQAIGEDEANYMPSKYLGLFGAETWGGMGDRSWRVHVEYADTACGFDSSAPQWGCAYRNGNYNDGYQYRDRVIGHAIDGDSQQIAAGLMLVAADGSSWELAAQSAKVNRESVNRVHSVARYATKIRSADLYHRRELLGGDLRLGIGYAERESELAGEDDGAIRGFAGWTWQFR
jgi:hypothetical protein